MKKEDVPSIWGLQSVCLLLTRVGNLCILLPGKTLTETMPVCFSFMVVFVMLATSVQGFCLSAMLHVVKTRGRRNRPAGTPWLDARSMPGKGWH